METLLEKSEQVTTRHFLHGRRFVKICASSEQEEHCRWSGSFAKVADPYRNMVIR